LAAVNHACTTAQSRPARTVLRRDAFRLAARNGVSAMLNGYKTYIVGTLTALGAIGGWLTGDMTPVAALNLAVPAVLAMTVRHGVSAKAT
jgi:hypothetical protein